MIDTLTTLAASLNKSVKISSISVPAAMFGVEGMQEIPLIQGPKEAVLDIYRATIKDWPATRDQDHPPTALYITAEQRNHPPAPPLGVFGGMGPLASLGFLDLLHSSSEQTDSITINLSPTPDRSTIITMAQGTEKDRALDDVQQRFESAAQWMREHYGVQHIGIPCNTAHGLGIHGKIPEIQDMIRACHELIIEDGIQRIVFLGTVGTKNSRLYENPYFETIYPDAENQEKITKVIFGIKEKGEVTEEECRLFAEVLQAYKAESKKFLLGCTEIPLVANHILLKQYLSEEDLSTAEFIDPMQALAQGLIANYNQKHNAG